jgi:hypothetical protein
VGREPAAGFTPTLSGDLVDAVHWFWLATAARRARGDLEHSTMLVHPSVKIDVHESYRPLFIAVRQRALAGLDSGDPVVLDRWRNYWEKEAARVPAADWKREQNTFEEVLMHLRDVVHSTTIVLDNYRSQDRLDYSTGESVVAIAVGGNTLSRGLTLEGLVVSFFVRSATAYDTLLQMGRWFGYRTGYEDLPRIWMTPALHAAFRHLATVEHEMRDDIDRYQRQNLRPDQVAVRIRTHPSLRITAKMGAAQPADVSYAGGRVQTRYFYPKDAEWLGRNLEAARVLVQNALRHGSVEPRETARVIQDVPVGLIASFLSTYKVHRDSPDLDPSLIQRYIDKQLESDPQTLAKWSVAVAEGDGALTDLAGLEVKAVIRSRLNDEDPDRADIKTLMSKQDRVLDLDITAAKARAMPEAALRNARDDDAVHGDRGLLVLYPIDPTSEPADSTPVTPGGRAPRVRLDAVDTVIGVGLVFPGYAGAKNSVSATHLAVDLTDVEQEDLDDALDHDTESGPA